VGLINRHVRSRAAAFGGAAVTAVVAVLLSATPAWACTLAVSGVTSCRQSNESVAVVNWTIHNNQAEANRPMTIVSANATVNGTSYPVTGFATTLPPLGTTTATTDVPGSVADAATGSAAPQITLTIKATWPDNNKNHASATVTLMGVCPPPATTPTTSPNSSQNHGTTPTTTAGTPSLPPGSGVESLQGGPTTTAPGGAQLPFTGNSTTIYALFGIALFVGGILLVRSSKHDGLEGVDER
jgi:LPXTG-motif cell wall-anchored protein